MINENRDAIKSYYTFADEEKEVRFLRYDMPSPWMNYLSNGTFHTMMSQAGGAVAFHRSPQIWRINRYRFFHLPTDRSGLYIYIQDTETGAYWCPTAEPAFLKPESWESAHGMGYTRFTAERDGISATLCYHVSPFTNVLIWNLKLKNTSGKSRTLRVFAYVEFGMMEFMRELQWQCYNKHQLKVRYLEKQDSLVYEYAVEMQPKPEETPLIYMAADRKLTAFDGDRDEFVGSYRSESNPYAIESNGCTNSTLFGGDACGALQFDIALEEGAQDELNVFLGSAMDTAEIELSLNTLRKKGFAEQSFEALRDGWDDYLSRFSCKVPDDSVQRMVNIWNPYQAQRNFLFSRNISFYATGTFRGVGYRDTAQDILSMVPFDTKAAREKVLLLLSQQYEDGHVNHYFFPNEGWEPVTRVHSDNHLWTIMDVYHIVMEEGHTEFLDEKLAYFDNGQKQETVLQHLERAIAFTLSKIGPNGFPLMLHSDWNDMLYKVCREGKGESVWTSMQFIVVLRQMEELYRILGNTEKANEMKRLYGEQVRLVEEKAWDGDWYRRATMDSGEFLGRKEQEEARIWLNAQTWAVLSGAASPERAKRAMDSVSEILDTELGIKKIHPPIVKFPSEKDPLSHYNPGTGENGSVFCHANSWAVIAECILKRPDRAFKYYRQLIPEVAMEKAGVWRYKAEPYVYVSNLFGPQSDRFGLANVSWLTGTASWMYLAVTQYILGVRAAYEGLLIDPCLPQEWNGAEVNRMFRGVLYRISYKRGKDKGVFVDGQKISGNIVPHDSSKKEVEVIAII